MAVTRFSADMGLTVVLGIGERGDHAVHMAKETSENVWSASTRLHNRTLSSEASRVLGYVMVTDTALINKNDKCFFIL